MTKDKIKKLTKSDIGFLAKLHGIDIPEWQAKLIEAFLAANPNKKVLFAGLDMNLIITKEKIERYSPPKRRPYEYIIFDDVITK